jgi:hypothetical protein
MPYLDDTARQLCRLCRLVDVHGLLGHLEYRLAVEKSRLLWTKGAGSIHTKAGKFGAEAGERQLRSTEHEALAGLRWPMQTHCACNSGCQEGGPVGTVCSRLRIVMQLL